MPPSRNTDELQATPLDVASLILRVPLGILLIMTGVQHLLEPAAADVEQAGGPVPVWLSEEQIVWMWAALPYAEIVIGALFGLGLFGRIAAAATVLMLVSLCVVVGWSHPSAPFSPRLIYLSVAAAVLLLGPGIISADFIIFGDRRSRR